MLVAAARDLVVRVQAWSKADEFGGEARRYVEFADRSSGRIRAEVVAATGTITSREGRNASDGLGGEEMPAEAGSGQWRGIGRRPRI